MNPFPIAWSLSHSTMQAPEAAAEAVAITPSAAAAPVAAKAIASHTPATQTRAPITTPATMISPDLSLLPDPIGTQPARPAHRHVGELRSDALS